MSDLKPLDPSKPAATRDGYGRGLVRAGQKNADVVALDADLAESTRSEWFAKRWPDRFFQMGISEQDMIGVAAGLAASGKIAYASTFAIFSERAFEHFRNVVARPNLNVKLCGSHGGLLTGQDGSSAQCIEDVAIYRALPNVAVIVPSDVVEAEMATLALLERAGPSYMRTTRDKVPVMHPLDSPFVLGRAEILEEGTDVALVACGAMVVRALEAARILAGDGVSAAVVNMSSVKPLDVPLLERVARATGSVVTCEDHNIVGGLAGACAEALAETYPCRMARIGVQDTFGESGSPEDLYRKYGLTPNHIRRRALQLMERPSAALVPT